MSDDPHADAPADEIGPFDDVTKVGGRLPVTEEWLKDAIELGEQHGSRSYLFGSDVTVGEPEFHDENTAQEMLDWIEAKQHHPSSSIHVADGLGWDHE